jgi:hypothetical protein
MGFMKPNAQQMKMYHVDSSMGTELIPYELIGEIDLDGDPDDLYDDHFEDYLEGKEIYDIGLKEGWYSQLLAKGTMDSTDWNGPHNSELEALDAIKNHHQVDDEGDLVD